MNDIECAEIPEAIPDAERSPSGPEEDDIEENGPKSLRIEIPSDSQNQGSNDLSPRDLDQL